MDFRAGITVFVGRITNVTGATPDGNCTTIRVDGNANSIFNPRDIIQVTNHAVENLISCDVQMKAPVKDDFFQLWRLADGTQKLFLMNPQVLFKDC